MSRTSEDVVLDWIPCSSDDDLRPPKELKSFQRDWFENLKWAMFRNRQMQGYLPVTSDLWKIAGSHRRDYWDANKSEVMIAFKFRRAAGYGEVMYLPALLKVIDEQRKLLQQKKSRGNVGRKVGDYFISQSVFDFEVQKQHTSETVPKKSPKMIEREQRELQSRICEARKRGLA